MNLTASELAWRRLHSQRLVGPPLPDAAAVVAHLGAVQAQDYAGASWALAQRAPGTTAAEIDRLFAAGAILRTHLMRPTWHFVTPADIRWLLTLTAPRVHAANRPHYLELELDPETQTAARRTLISALQGGNCRTRDELAAILATAGIAATGRRLIYLLMQAELDGVICSGPRRGKQFTYALLDERAPAAPPTPRDEALAELARRYLASHAPATEHDFAWWSGLTVGDARTAFALNDDRFERAVFGDRPVWFDPAAPAVPPPVPAVHLLPNYDEYLVAYRDHAPSFSPEIYAAFGRDNSVVMANLVAVDGLGVGRWRRTLVRRSVTIALDLLRPLTAAERTGLASAASAYGDFLGLPVAVRNPT